MFISVFFEALYDHLSLLTAVRIFFDSLSHFLVYLWSFDEAKDCLFDSTPCRVT